MTWHLFRRGPIELPIDLDLCIKCGSLQVKGLFTISIISQNGSFKAAVKRPLWAQSDHR